MRRFLLAIYFGLAIGGIMIALVFATGSTFGQRCAKLWTHGSPEWNDCVERFARGLS